MRFCLFVLVAAACHHGATDDDCRLVASDPSHAMTTIANHHQGDPAAAAEVIEKCLAPSGDECERMQKILPALPAMMPATTPIRETMKIAELCKGMPPEMRRCMFPSYMLRHGDECSKVLDKMQTPLASLDIKPATAPTPCEKPDIEVAIGSAGVDVASGSAKQHRDGALDLGWLEDQLKPYVIGDCHPAVVVKAGAAVRYQDVISAMDSSIKVGLVDVALDTPGQGSGSAHPPSRGKPDLATAPVVVVTKTEVSFAAKHVATIAELEKGAISDPIPELARVLPATTNGLAILQADQDTDARVITRIVNALRTAGFDNVMFAVKKR